MASNQPQGTAATTGPNGEEPPKPSILGLCCACICAIVLCPLICCCCCTAAAAEGVHGAVQKSQGKRWDAKQGKWVVENMEEDKEFIAKVPVDDEDILKTKEAEKETDSEHVKDELLSSTKKVKETEYYEVLGVSPDAEPSKIKKAYYIKARKWHPDRNDTPEAKEKFQKIGEAYQVLSDEKLRAHYDREGKEGLSGDRTEISVDSVDPALVFTFLFGSDSFNDIIGRLNLVTLTLLGGNPEDGQQLSQDDQQVIKLQLQEIEKRRTIRLSIALADRIKKYVEAATDGEKQTAKLLWENDAKTLVEASYGEAILNCVGTTYKLVATEYLGKWGEGMGAKVEQQKMQMEAAKKIMEAARDQQQPSPEGEDDEANNPLKKQLELMWNVTVIDISSTLREVVMKVCCDTSVTDEIRVKRAEAIKELGDVFEKAKSSNPSEMSVRGIYQKAAMAAMEETIEKKRREEEEQEAKE